MENSNRNLINQHTPYTKLINSIESYISLNFIVDSKSLQHNRIVYIEV